MTLIKYLEPYGIALCVTMQAVYFWELVYVKQSQILTFMFKISDRLWEQPMQSDYSRLGTMQNIEHAPPIVSSQKSLKFFLSFLLVREKKKALKIRDIKAFTEGSGTVRDRIQSFRFFLWNVCLKPWRDWSVAWGSLSGKALGLQCKRALNSIPSTAKTNQPQQRARTGQF